MQMIDVLKRLAELDSSNAQVENKLATVESLMTVSNGADSDVNECGGMGMMAGPHHSPASINMTANSGEELSTMLKSLVSLAGIEKSDDSHQEIDLGTPHAIAPSSNDDMAASIDLITKMDGDDDHEADDDSLNLKKDNSAEEGHGEPGSFNSDGSYNTSDDDANDFDDLEHDDEENTKETWNNSPDPEVGPHDNGDRYVTSKPQGFKQRMGDNPYTPARESVESLADRLLSEFHEFISEGKEAKPDFPDVDDDGNTEEPIKKAAADRKSKKKVESVEEGILHRGAAWLAKKLSAFAGYKALKPGTYIIPPLEPMGGKPISFTINSKGDYPNLNMSGQERSDFNPNRLYDHIKAHIQSGNYDVAPSSMQRDYSQKMIPKDNPRKDNEVDEGLGKALLGGAALIAAITGLNKMQANHMMQTEPQLITLAQMRQEAEQKGNTHEVKQLDDRIKKTMDHISVTGRPVMGGDGEPIDPRNPWAGESVETVSELTKGAKWKYTELGRKSVDDLATKATDADSRDGANKLMNKALKRQDNVRKVEKDLVGGRMHEDSVEESLDAILKLALGKSVGQ